MSTCQFADCDETAKVANSDLAMLTCWTHDAIWDAWVADGNLRTPIAEFWKSIDA